MKKLILLVLVLALSACTSATEVPVAAPTDVPPTPTPVVVVQTVVVEATQAPTEVPPTAVPPTAVPPTAAPVVVTVVVEPTQVPPTQAPVQQPAGNSPIKLDDVLGKGVFTNMTMTGDKLTLRCTPRDITFNVTTSNTTIVDVLFWYRIMDVNRQYQKDYKNFGKMVSNGGGNFSLTFSGEDVHPDLRLDGGWLDFQFVGLAKSGDVVDRSQTIEGLVKYTFDCPK